jgi:hypothetical protein
LTESDLGYEHQGVLRGIRSLHDFNLKRSSKFKTEMVAAPRFATAKSPAFRSRRGADAPRP